MSFLDTMREILETEGLLKHDTQKARPLSSTVLPTVLPQTAESAPPVPVSGVLQPGDLIRWQNRDGKTHGPALVEHVTLSGGRRWAWVTWDGMERAVSEVIITAVEPGEQEHA